MVPENLVGIAYKDFDEGQKRECFDWRRKNGLCTKPAVNITDFSNLQHGIPEAHKHNGKPKLLTAETGAVPENLVGIAYKDFTEDQKKEYRDWRRANGLCLFCGSNGHQQSGCELRKVYLAKVCIQIPQ
ncbi:hypothetical protein EJ08DRAFT_650358 [Tothia fuscella]|uniref:Uncharacterized protein n=1 Tax=Tothia fuscella TaxID=1048955 RepID=A0A9P4NP77_9PEZI|nr:hypothetical protein EJ08DRAFT_650358 [Tothia fuscella]